MKRFYRLTVVLIVLGYVGTAVFLMLGPDSVPAHYNIAGEVDRIGSKYEYIAFPCIAAVSGAIFLLLAKRARTRKWEDYALTEKIFAVCAVGEVLLFNGIGFSCMWKAAFYPESAAISAMPAMDWMRFSSFFIGILLIVLGNVMPKARKNAIFGLRTRWSMSGGEVWRKSQRFRGFTSVLAGALLLADAAFLKGVTNLLVQTAVLVLWVTAGITASYRYYKTEGSAGKNNR